jgi:hypothetical protein
LEANYAQRGSASQYGSLQVTIDLPIFQSRRQDPDIAAKMALVRQAQALKRDSLRQHVAKPCRVVRLGSCESTAEGASMSRCCHCGPTTNQCLASRIQWRTGTLATVLDARRSSSSEAQQLQLAADQARAYPQLLYFLPEENTR